MSNGDKLRVSFGIEEFRENRKEVTVTNSNQSRNFKKFQLNNIIQADNYFSCYGTRNNMRTKSEN